MGRKGNPSQRTKGNLKPSSSARAAELLEASGSVASGFLGFGLPGGAAAQEPEELDSGIDKDFALVIKKVTKRDSTTKIKALQHFSQLCKEKETDVVNSILQYWPKVYLKLTTDSDIRVRQVANEAFEQLVLRVRRNLAPQLKHVMGPWMVAQCDAFPVVASAAQSAFNAAFSTDKQSDAVGFCRLEILLYIEDQLLKQPVQTAKDTQTQTAEIDETAIRCEQMQGSSLEALNLFVKKLPTDLHKTVCDLYRQILKNSKFWKLNKHSCAQVRAGFYHVISSFCETSPELMLEFSEQLCPAVLYSLDETDPFVAPAVWEAILYTVSTISDWFSRINAKKGMFPKLWKLLENGGYGSAVHSYPSLLPFLSFIPLETEADKLTFLGRFFSEMKAGLKVQRVQQSPSELNAIIKAYAECMKFYLQQSLTSSEQEQQILRFLTLEQIIPLIEASFTESCPTLSRSRLYKDVVELLVFINRTLDELEKQKQGQMAKTMFTEIIVELSEKIFYHHDSGNLTSLTRIAAFLEKFSPLAEGDKHTTKLEKVVKFDDGKQLVTDDALKYVHLKPKEFLQNSNLSNFVKDAAQYEEDFSKLTFVSEIVNQICLKSLNKAKTNSDTGYMVFFCRVFKVFADEELISFLMKGISQNPQNEIAFSAMSFMKEVLLPWIYHIDSESGSSNLRDDCLLEVAMVAYNKLDIEDKLQVLKDLVQRAATCHLLYRLIQQLVAASCDAAIRLWLREAEFGEFVVMLVHDLCQWSSKVSCDRGLSDRNDKWSLLCLALSTNEVGEPYIGEHYLGLVLSTIHSSLPSFLHAEDDSVNQCVIFLCDVAYQFLSNIPDCVMIPSSDALLLAIFQLSLDPPSTLSDAVLKKACDSWKQGFHQMIMKTGYSITQDSILGKAIKCLKDAVHENGRTLERLQHCVDIALLMMNIISEESGGSNALLDHLCFGFIHGQETLWKHSLLVGRQMLFTSEESTEVAISSLVVPDCVAPVIFTSLLIKNIPCNSGKLESEADICSETKVTTADLICDSKAINESGTTDVVQPLPNADKWPDCAFEAADSVILDLALALGFCRSVTRNHSVHPSSELFLTTMLLEKNYVKLTSSLPEEALKRILITSFEHSVKDDDIWCLGLQVLLQRLNEMRFECNFLMAFGGMDRFIPLSPSLVMTLQVAIPFFGADDVLQLAKMHLALMMTCQESASTELIESALHYMAVFNATFALQDTQSDEGMTNFIEIFHSAFAVVHDWRENHDSFFIFETNVSTKNWNVILFNVEVMRFFTLTVNKMATVLDSSQWDFILCSTVSWIQYVSENHRLPRHDLSALILISSAADLLDAISVCMLSVVPERPNSFPPNLLSEWKDLFSSTAYNLLLPLFLEVSEQCLSTQNIPSRIEVMLQSLCSAMVHCPTEHLLDHKLDARLVAGEDSNLPDSLQTLLNYCCPLLSSEYHCIQLCVYRILMKVVPELPKYDEKTPVLEGINNSESSRPLPHALMAVVEAGNQNLRTMLDGVMFGVTVSINQYHLSFSSAKSYLLGWKLLLQFFKMSASELRAQYVQWLSEHGTVDDLMHNLFILMPQNPVIVLKDSLVSNDTLKKLSSCRSMFTDEPSFNFRNQNIDMLTSWLQHIACTVYHCALETLPAVIRQWWTDQDKHVSGVVEKYTAKHLSPLLCTKELQTIQESKLSFGNMTVKARPTSREVVATYTVEESSMVLTIMLPANMPFGSVTVESGNRVSVAKPQWRNWILQLIVFLSFQNGSILDGLSMWKRNVDKHFEGVEECMICFSVIHGSNYQLPKLQCKTCKKRFHSTCLYKWFRTSNNSTCPLCRNLF